MAQPQPATPPALQHRLLRQTGDLVGSALALSAMRGPSASNFFISLVCSVIPPSGPEVPSEVSDAQFSSTVK